MVVCIFKCVYYEHKQYVCVVFTLDKYNLKTFCIPLNVHIYYKEKSN